MTSEASGRSPRHRAGTAGGRATRLLLSGLALVVIAAGLAVHRFVAGAIGDIVGDALYACLIYLLLAIVFPGLRATRLGALAVAVCVGVELLQLTGLPALLAAALPPAALVLGTGFDARDLVVYALAILVAVLVHGAISAQWRQVSPRADTQEGALPKESAL
ncbi:DUF2809 domain-containing protein [Microbacterium sp.]|uniref:ribosomal maturation YjgA family protein n=1 Tax=Microbacterium sp. TaxID=51671 RepID=UPI00281261D7|nr:DUF2809 domain-containing protein [Microbacterium sp.]